MSKQSNTSIIAGISFDGKKLSTSVGVQHDRLKPSTGVQRQYKVELQNDLNFRNRSNNFSLGAMTERINHLKEKSHKFEVNIQPKQRELTFMHEHINGKKQQAFVTSTNLASQKANFNFNDAKHQLQCGVGTSWQFNNQPPKFNADFKLGKNK